MRYAWHGAAAALLMATPVHAEVVSSGTGFIVSPQGHVVTNHHVVHVDTNQGERRCSRLDVIQGEFSTTASFVADEPQHDLAVLRLAKLPPGTSAAVPASTGGVDADLLGSNRGGGATSGGGSAGVATFAARTVSAGQTVIALGYPLNGLADQLKIVTGVVSSTAGIRNDISNFQHSAPINPGNSGGPAVDQSGRLIGVNVAGYNSTIKLVGTPVPVPAVIRAQLAEAGLPASVTVAELQTGRIPQNVNFAIKAETVTAFLDALRVPYVKAASGSVVPTEEVYRQAQGYTVQVFCHR